MLGAMNLWTSSSPALRPVGPPAAEAALAGTQATDAAAAWFNAPVVEGSLLLRAPVQPGVGDADTLRQRFLSSLQGPEAA